MTAPNGKQHKHRLAPFPEHQAYAAGRTPLYRPGSISPLPAHPAIRFVLPFTRNPSALRDAAHPEQSGQGARPAGSRHRGSSLGPTDPSRTAGAPARSQPQALRGLPVPGPPRSAPPALPRTQRPNVGLRAAPLPEPEPNPPPPFWDRRRLELTCMPGTCTATGEWAMAGCGGRAPPAAPSSRPPCCWAAAAGPGRTKRRGAASARAALPPSLPARPRPPPTHLAGAAGPSCATRAGSALS